MKRDSIHADAINPITRYSFAFESRLEDLHHPPFDGLRSISPRRAEIRKVDSESVARAGPPSPQPRDER